MFVSIKPCRIYYIILYSINFGGKIMKLGYLSVTLAVFCCLLVASTTYYKVKYDSSVRNHQSFRLDAE